MSTLTLAGLSLHTTGTPIHVLKTSMTVFGTGRGLGNEFLLLFAMAERRDLGVATTGIRFVEALGASLNATVYTSMFGAMVPASSCGGGLPRT